MKSFILPEIVENVRMLADKNPNITDEELRQALGKEGEKFVGKSFNPYRKLKLKVGVPLPFPDRLKETLLGHIQEIWDIVNYTKDFRDREEAIRLLERYSQYVEIP